MVYLNDGMTGPKSKAASGMKIRPGHASENTAGAAERTVLISDCSVIRSLRLAGMLFLVFSAALSRAEVLFNYGYNAGFQLIEEPVNPRLIGMGTAGTALGSSGFYHYNPAAPFLHGNRYLSFEYGRNYGEMHKGAIEIGWLFNKWFLAAALPTNTIRGIYPADALGTGVNYATPFSQQQSMAAIDIGYHTGRFAFALCFNGIQDRIENNTGYALSVSAGAAFWILPHRLSAGAAGFFPEFLTASKGMRQETDEWGEGAALNKIARIGAAWTDSLKSIGYTVTADVVYNNMLANVTIPAGIEAWVLRFLALRFGKRFNHDTDVFNFGLGLRLLPVLFDASFVITSHIDDTDLKWLLGLSYLIPAQKNRAE